MATTLPDVGERREGEPFRGFAVVHAVYEHEDWFSTGWTFSRFFRGSLLGSLQTRIGNPIILYRHLGDSESKSDG